MMRPQALPGSILVHPIALGAMAVTWCNDHYCKPLRPGWFTGKLSDFAGLTFFPFWAAGCVELLLLLFGRRWLARTPFMVAVVVTTAIGFAAIKTRPGASQAYEQFIADVRSVWLRTSAHRIRVSNTVDPTDLIALPALGLALWVARKRDAHRRSAAA